MKCSIVIKTKYYETAAQSKGFILVEYNLQDTSSLDPTSRECSLYVSSTHAKTCLSHGNRRYPFSFQTVHHFPHKWFFTFQVLTRKHVFPMEIAKSVRDEKLQNTQIRLPPTCSFCTHPPRPLFIGGMERWVSSRRMGKKTHLKAHLSLMVLSRFGRRKMREKLYAT